MLISSQLKFVLRDRFKGTYVHVSDYRSENQMSCLLFILKELKFMTENDRTLRAQKRD